MAQIVLNRARIARVRQGVAAGMAQHMRVAGEGQARDLSQPTDQLAHRVWGEALAAFPQKT